MNRIEDERIKFYLQHEERIREWASLETEVIKLADRFYRSLKGDLDAAVRSGKIGGDGVDSFLDETWPHWPGLVLRRQDWPQGDEGPHVRLQWHTKTSCFPPHGELICGVMSSSKKHRQPFTKEARPAYPLQNSWWPAYKNVEPPEDGFWEGDNLKEYRNHLVATILKAWKDLSPLVDKAVGHQLGS